MHRRLSANAQKLVDVEIKRLHDLGLTNMEIISRTGYPRYRIESSVQRQGLKGNREASFIVVERRLVKFLNSIPRGETGSTVDYRNNYRREVAK